MLGISRELTIFSLTVRVILSLVIGGMLGLERGRKNRPAGFRTYMLVCLGAALVMTTNQFAVQHYGTGDPVRMGAQVISGIGFLGAGSIVLNGRNQIKGITTAAGMWAAACCGLAIGIGYYEGAIIGGIAILLVMTIMHQVDLYLRKRSMILELYVEYENCYPFSQLIGYLREHSIDLMEMEFTKGTVSATDCQSAIILINGKQLDSRDEVLAVVSASPGMRYFAEL